MTYLLAIDQGTTSSRAIIYTQTGIAVAQHQLPLQCFYPENGWVEQDPEEIWQTTVNCCLQAISKAGLKAQHIAAIGISNQRETSIIWDKQTGKAIYPAIVWQDRRTDAQCQNFIHHGCEDMVREKTGLLIDPYFSATKISWILENVLNAKEMAKKGQLAFGTIDTFLVWRFTHGERHVTDISNASRTSLFNIKTLQWDEELLRLFDVPAQLLPEVLKNTAHFGTLNSNILGHSIPITGIAGDQQAALIGESCFQRGDFKSTFGTGLFTMVNTGNALIYSKHRMLTTIAYHINDSVYYALEGSAFNAGTGLHWLKENLHLLGDFSAAEKMASELPNNGGVYFVPAFTGLGAPYWNAAARGGILGLTRNSSFQHIVRAALEAVVYQSCDLIHGLLQDIVYQPTLIKVDGGMTHNHWLMQFLADLLNIPIESSSSVEMSALGAAYLAGLQMGIFESVNELATQWQCQHRFEPRMPENLRKELYQGWLEAIKRVS